ncbi:transporter substrate-binding domain-containing protein [Ureibacillus sp. NPDC094379]
MLKRSKVLNLFMMLFCVFILVACSSSSKEEVQVSGSTDSKSGETSKKLIVGTDTSYMPFEFLDNKTGEYVGFDIELIDAILSGLEIEYELEPMDFNGIIPALQTNGIDLAIAGITKTEERAQVIDFSEGYYDAGTQILVQIDNEDINNLEDLTDKVVATKQGTASFEIVKEIEGIKKVVPFPNIDQAYMELEKGAADAVVFDSPNVQYYAQTVGAGKAKVVGEVFEAQEFAIAFPKGSELKAKVDEQLAKLVEDGTYDEIYTKWFGEAPNK